MITESFARCVAKISGDGYLYYRYVRYANTCPVLLNEFRADMRKEFPEITITKGVTNTGTPFLQVGGKQVVRRFLEYLPDYHSDKIRIPTAVKEASMTIKQSYLRAFYDDEGCAALRICKKPIQWKRNITLTSNSRDILEEVKKMLSDDFCIVTNNIIRNKNEDRAYVLGISGKDNFLKFRKHIGFNHPKKQQRLEFMILSYNCTPKRNELEFNKLTKNIKKMGLIRSQ